MSEIRLQDAIAAIRECLQDTRYDEAIAGCRRILAHFPESVDAHELLGEAYLEKGMYPEAVECLQRTLSVDPETALAHVGLALIFDSQGRQPDAIWHLERAFDLAPGNAQVRKELQRLYTRRDGAQVDGLKLTRGAMGRVYAHNRLFSQAIAEYTEVLRNDPNLPDVRMGLAECLWREGQFAEAAQACTDLLAVLPSCLKANLILGQILMVNGHEDEAQQRLDVAQRLDPENRMADELMGEASPLPRQEVMLPEAPEPAELTAVGELEPAKQTTEAVAEGATPLPEQVAEEAGAPSAVLPEPIAEEPAALAPEALVEEAVPQAERIAEQAEAAAPLEAAIAEEPAVPMLEPATEEGAPEPGTVIEEAGAAATALAPAVAVTAVPSSADEAAQAGQPPVEEMPAAEEAVSIPEEIAVLPAAGAAEESALPLGAPPEEVTPVAELVAAPTEVGPAPSEAGGPEEPEAPAQQPPSWVRQMAESVSAPGAPPGAQALPVAFAEPAGLTAEQRAGRARVLDLQALLWAQPGNYRARIELARRLVLEQDWEGALTQYEELIAMRKLIPGVLSDLQKLVGGEADQVQVHRLLGDSYMELDQIEPALEMYRLARQLLRKH